MADLLQYPAKICLTVGGTLVHQGKILLIKHKKLGIWLNPGGHIEPNEVPHQTAEREFWEETGVKVRAISTEPLPAQLAADNSQYLPTPFLTNLHWVSQKNYQERTAAGEPIPLNPQMKKLDSTADKKWSRGCEQHLNFLFLLKLATPDGSTAYKQNLDESDGIGWFTLEEALALPTNDNIRFEIKKAFELRQSK